MFAADCEADLHRWMKAFHSGTSIQVQPVSTVEEIRITDLEMQKRWTTLDRNNSSQSTLPPEVRLMVECGVSIGNREENVLLYVCHCCP